MPLNSSEKPKAIVRAGALLCPKCCVEYQDAEVDIECNGKVLRNVKMLRCPACKEELFTPEQHDSVMERIRAADEYRRST